MDNLLAQTFFSEQLVLSYGKQIPSQCPLRTTLLLTSIVFIPVIIRPFSTTVYRGDRTVDAASSSLSERFIDPLLPSISLNDEGKVRGRVMSLHLLYLRRWDQHNTYLNKTKKSDLKNYLLALLFVS